MHDIDFSKFVQPYPGHHVSGDCAVVKGVADGLFLGIVDVLGHGPEAHDLAAPIEEFLEEHGSNQPALLLNKLDGFLRGSRGAAAGLAFLEAASGNLQYAGIGNTVIRKFGNSEIRLVSRDGIVGQNMRTPRLERMTLSRGDVLVMYSDGVREHFALRDYPQLLSDTACTITAQVVRRFGKGHDDACCIAVRYR